jgi:hypothetical protein
MAGVVSGRVESRTNCPGSRRAPWLWLGALPLTALLLFYGAYRLRSIRNQGRHQPVGEHE